MDVLLIVLYILLILSIITFQIVNIIVLVIFIALHIRNKIRSKITEDIIKIVDPEYTNYDKLKTYPAVDKISTLVKDKYNKLFNGISEDIGIFKLNEVKKLYKNKNVNKFKKMFKNILIEHDFNKHTVIKENILTYKNIDIKMISEYNGVPIHMLREVLDTNVVIDELMNYYDLKLSDTDILKLMKYIINKKSKKIKVLLTNYNNLTYYTYYNLIKVVYIQSH